MLDSITKLCSAFFFGLRDFLNGITNTIWGLVVIFWALYLLAHHVDASVAYYFAGVGSTLLGISSQHGQTNNFTGKQINIPPGPLNVGSVSEGGNDAEGKDR